MSDRGDEPGSTHDSSSLRAQPVNAAGSRSRCAANSSSHMATVCAVVSVAAVFGSSSAAWYTWSRDSVQRGPDGQLDHVEEGPVQRGQLRRQRADRHRLGPARPDRAGHLDAARVGQAGDQPAVADVHVQLALGRRSPASG